MTEITDADVTQADRELLAIEYEREVGGRAVDALRHGGYDLGVNLRCALRAIAAARKTQMPAMATDEMVNIGYKAYGDWMDFRGYGRTYPHRDCLITAINAALAAAPRPSEPDVAAEGRGAPSQISGEKLPAVLLKTGWTKYVTEQPTQTASTPTPPDPLLAFADAVCRFADRSCVDAEVVAEIKAATDELRAGRE